MSEVVGAELLRSWVSAAVAALGESRAEIDALNVFPVPDGDTGTNMYLTMEAAALAMAEIDEHLPPVGEARAMTGLAAALTRGALLGARGNSGVILSQILRGMVRMDPVTGGHLRDAADAIRTGLDEASTLAYASVARPVEGTMLTVVRAAAESAASCESSEVADVVIAAADGASRALAATPEMLPVLKQAGVVDAGGKGVCVILDALAEVVTGVRKPRSLEHAKLPTVIMPADGYEGPRYEVMYLLESDDDRVPDLKRDLDSLGESLVVVGGDRLWNIHVHVDDAGAAIEAGMACGRPYRLRVTWLTDTGAAVRKRGLEGRGVVAVAHGPGVVALLEKLGVESVPSQPRIAPSTGEILAAVAKCGAGEVVILPSDKDTRPAAEAAAVTARQQGTRVAVVPTRSIVQSLSAIAVHDPGLAFDDDVVSMSRASGATRYGAVTVSSRDAMTSAGLCNTGDILGVVDGDIIEVGSDVFDVAVNTIERLMSAGGELVTIVTGADAEESAVDELKRSVCESHPGVEVEVFEGLQPYWPLIFGVE
ncbi:MAG: DAK2 domain-containing protein [Candidatus Nanopelagicales bacterium]|nr:DAK2 domain-containing protein [Candidatus Nanopelagicales bacterium]